MATLSITTPDKFRVIYPWMPKKSIYSGDIKREGYWTPSGFTEPDALVTDRNSKIFLPDVDGVYQEVDQDKLSRTNRGLYVNGQATNLLRWSQEFDRSTWLKSSNGSGVTPVVTPGAAIAPDGSISAALIELDIGSGEGSNDWSWLYQNHLAIAGTTYNTSFFVRAASPSEIGKVLRVSNILSGGASNITLTAEWQRVSIQETELASQTRSFGLRLRGGEATAKSARFFLWQGQVTITDFTAPPILTTSAAETLFASDIRAVQGVRPSNSEPEPFPDWEVAGLDDGFGIIDRVNVDHLNSTSVRAITSIGIGKNNHWVLYLDTDNKVKFKLVDFPLSFFSGSQQGIWLDGEDNSVMWQDAAGTVPVTALGQPVGLILDKRLWGGKTYKQVMAAQPQIFETPSIVAGDWTNNGDGSFTFTSTGAGGAVQVNNAVTPGKFYELLYTVSDYTGTGLIQPQFTGGGNVTGVTAQGNGVYRCVMLAANTNSAFRFIVAMSATFNATVSNISLKEIPGNHAYQLTAGSRPTWQEDDLGARGLLFNPATNDYLVTPSIDFSGSDKVMVAAGVRKLSDVTIGPIAQIGNFTNDGHFLLSCPQNGSFSRAAFSARNAVTAVFGNNFAAPASAVLTGLADRGAGSVLLRQNGAQVGSNSGLFAGSFANATLALGFYANTYFSGFIHQLVVRGGDLPDADELAQLETYIGDKSKTIDTNILQSGAITTPGTYDIVVRCKSGDYSLGISGGVAGDANASVETLPGGATTLRVGSLDGINPWNDWIYGLHICKPLTDQEMLDWVNGVIPAIPTLNNIPLSTNTNPIISGTCDFNTTKIYVYVDGIEAGTALGDENDTWRCKLSLAPGTYQITARSESTIGKFSDYSEPITLVIADELSISGTPETYVQEGVEYSFTPTTTGGVPPYTYTLEDMNTMPDGMSIDPNTGELSGYPNPGIYEGIVIQVEDQE